MVSEHRSRRDPPPLRRTDRPLLSVRVSPSTIAWVLSTIAVLLAVAHLMFSLNYHYIEQTFPAETILYVLFDLTGEVTIPTWYSSSLLLAAGLLLLVIARLKQRLDAPFVRHWYVLGAMLVLLSIDEASDFHGAVSYKLSDVFGFGGALTYPWVLPAAVLVILVAIAYLPFIRHLPPETQRQVVLAAGLYVGGALGVEVIEAAYDSRFDYRAPYLIMVAIEETLEMLGVIVLLSALLSYAASFTRGIQVSLD
jgi:hypothetical protein